MESRTTADRLRSDVAILADDIGERHVSRPRALHAAADHVRSEWRRQGYEVASLEYDVRGVRCANLEISRRGSEHPGRILLIGAHYDTVPGTPGADDNGSGIAGLLELSRRFAAREPACTVRFVAFPNEEPPFFMRRRMGSMVYAREARRRGDDIALMVSLEMLGYYRDEPGSQSYPPLFGWFYPSRGDFIAFVSNLRSRSSMLRAVRAFRGRSDFPVQHAATPAIVPGVGWSDHLSFWRHGWRALMVTDTAFYRNPHYHGAGDTPDTLSYEPFARVIEGLERAFGDLAEDI